MNTLGEITVVEAPNKINKSITDEANPQVNFSQGWVKLYRKITTHWLWENPKSFQRWMTILLYVNHSPKKFAVGTELHVCEPGSSYRSLNEWARLFKTGKRHVKKFFELLQNDGMILCQIIGKGNRRKHLLTVVNWDEYQNMGTEKGTEKYPRTRMIKNDINGNLFFSLLKEEFIGWYKQAKGLKYYWQEKDSKAIKEIVDKMRARTREKELDDKNDRVIKEMFISMLNYIENQKDKGEKWLWANFTLANINGQFQAIIDRGINQKHAGH